jgi:hypothetical protein
MSFTSDILLSNFVIWAVGLWLVILWITLKPGKPIKGLKATFPDGPKPWPIIGNLFFFIKLFKDPDNVLMKLAKDYGGTCMLWFSSAPVMIISKAEDAKLLLDKVGPHSRRCYSLGFR